MDTDTNEPPQKWFSLFGLTVVRKADALAAAAFVLAISSTTIQIAATLRGAVLSIYGPDIVYFIFDQYPDGTTATRLAGQVSFVNSGDVNTSALVRDVAVNLRVGGVLEAIGDLKFQEQWLSFAQVVRSGTTLEFMPRVAARPILVKGSSAESETITFSPRVLTCPSSYCDRRANYVDDQKFLQHMSIGGVIDLLFTAHLIGNRRELRTACRVTIDSDFLVFMAANESYAARCLPIADGRSAPEPVKRRHSSRPT